MDEKIKKQIEEAKEIYGNHVRKFLKNDPEIIKECERILIQFPWFETINKVISGLLHGISEPPRCLYCGKVLKNYEGTLFGRIKCCCSQHGSFISEDKKKKTCLERYGTTTPLTNSEIKKKTEKTCLEKFGRTTFAGSKEHKEKVLDHLNYDEIIPKGIETKRRLYGEDWGKVLFESRRENMEKINLEKYGVKYLLSSKEFQDKTHDTMYERYGRRFFTGSDEIIQKNLDFGFENILSWSDHVIPLFTREEYVGRKDDVEYEWKCVKCGITFRSRIYSTGLGESGCVPRCPNCYKLGVVSIGEKELLFFVQSFGFSCVPNDKKLISPHEIDILIPELKLGIEYNGYYWHKDHEEDYHYNKYLKCEEKGFKLLQFYDFEFEEKRNLVLQTVLFYLKKIKQVDVDSDKIKTEICTKQETEMYYSDRSFSNKSGDYNISFSLKKQRLSMISVNTSENICDIVNLGFSNEAFRSFMMDYMVRYVEDLFKKEKTRLTINNRVFFRDEFSSFNIIECIPPREVIKKEHVNYDAGWTVLEKDRGDNSFKDISLCSIPKSKYYFQKSFF